MGLKPRDLFTGEAPDTTLGPWHATLIHINRRKCVLFANDRTLFNFIVPDVSRAMIRRLGELFIGHLHAVLAEEAFPPAVREPIAAEYDQLSFGKSQDRSVLGSMNDLAFHYEQHIREAGSVHSAEIPGIIRRVNRIPLKAIKYRYPVEALQAIYRDFAPIVIQPMNRYDPDHAPVPEQWLALDEGERTLLVERYHLDARIPLPESATMLHATLHVAVENQLAAGDEPVTQALVRLMGDGLSRHDAVHAIGWVLLEWIAGPVSSPEISPEAARAEYYAAIERLTATAWLAQGDE